MKNINGKEDTFQNYVPTNLLKFSTWQNLKFARHLNFQLSKIKERKQRIIAAGGYLENVYSAGFYTFLSQTRSPSLELSG